MENTEKSRDLPEAETENKPVAVRSYVMTRQRQEDWLAENESGAERLETPAPVKKIKEKDDSRKKFMGGAKKFLAVAIILVVLTTAFGVFWIVSNSKQIKTLNVVGTERYSGIRLGNACGLSIGSKLNGADSAANAQKILQKYTDLSNCIIKSDSEGNVTIYVEEYNAAVYFEFSGKYYAMTENLRVITQNNSSAVYEEAGLLKAEIPGATSAVCGRNLEVSDGDAAYISEFLRCAAEGGILEDLAIIRFTDRYSIETVSKDGTEVRYGSVDDLEKKIKIVGKVEEERADPGSTVRIDVSSAETAYIKVIE